MNTFAKLLLFAIGGVIPFFAFTQNLPAETGPAAFSGRVVDDDTGQPVNDFVTEWGAVDKDGVMKWGYSQSTSSNRRNGAFHDDFSWQTGELVNLRIIANGYLATPVVDQPEAAPTHRSGLVVRLKRGLTLHGIVIDQGGKPVDQARIFLAGAQPLEVEENDARGFKGTSTTTDVTGEFDLQGFDPDGGQRVVVSASGLAAVAKPGADQAAGKRLNVQLPQPAHLHVIYDIANDQPEAKLYIQLKTWESPDWTKTNFTRITSVGQKQNVEIDLSPGVYDFRRIHEVRMGDIGQTLFLDRRDITLKPGETQTIDLSRPHGRTLSGEIIGMKDAGVTHAMITVRAPQASGDSTAKDEWKLPQYDGNAVAQDDPHFTTAALEPGNYTLVVEAWRPETPEERMSTAWRLPAFVTTQKITIPADKAPVPVKIELKPYEPKTRASAE